MLEIYTTDDRKRKSYNLKDGVFILAESAARASLTAKLASYPCHVTGPIAVEMLRSADKATKLLGGGKLKTIGQWLEGR